MRKAGDKARSWRDLENWVNGSVGRSSSQLFPTRRQMQGFPHTTMSHSHLLIHIYINIMQLSATRCHRYFARHYINGFTFSPPLAPPPPPPPPPPQRKTTTAKTATPVYACSFCVDALKIDAIVNFLSFLLSFFLLKS